jgi:hypothetical protein
MIVLIFLWWLSGVSSFIYWFSQDHDVYMDDLVFGSIAGIVLGPAAFFFGWLIHGKKKPFVVFKKRGSK